MPEIFNQASIVSVLNNIDPGSKVTGVTKRDDKYVQG
jgi:hypothetical protein